MPEGPEVKLVATWLNELCTGKHLDPENPVQWDSKSRYAKKSGPPGYELLTDKTKFLIEEVRIKGKHIFFVVTSPNQGSNIIYLHSHLGMEGKWVLDSHHLPNGVSRPNSKDKSYARREHSNLFLNFLDLSTGNNKLYFNDSRHFGAFDVMTEEQYQKKIKAIGPDLLSEEVSLDQWSSVIKRKRIARKQICDFLMEQKYFSGIGNYLKSEILYRAQINPARALGNLSDDEIKTILEVSVKTIRESYRCGGLTIRSFYRPDGSTGEFVPQVYGRDTDPSGNPIIKTTFKDRRATYWVVEVQV